MKRSWRCTYSLGFAHPWSTVRRGCRAGCVNSTSHRPRLEHIRDREQSTVGAAEGRHGAVQGAGATVKEFAVGPDELGGRERRAHELRLEAEMVHHSFAVFIVR